MSQEKKEEEEQRNSNRGERTPIPRPTALGACEDCLVVIFNKDGTELGKRFALEADAVCVERSSDNAIVLNSDSVSRHHCHFERRPGLGWFIVDDGSTNGTYVDDDRIEGEKRLHFGERIKVGPTIFKFLSGTDLENLYHEEIYRLCTFDGLTEVHNLRTLFESLEREIGGSRRCGRPLSLVMFDIDEFRGINEAYGRRTGAYGRICGDAVLVGVARCRPRGQEAGPSRWSVCTTQTWTHEVAFPCLQHCSRSMTA